MMSRRRPAPSRGVVALVALVALAAVACSDGGAPTPVPAVVALVTAMAPAAEVGTTLPAAPSFVVRDAAGNALAGVAVSIVVGEGGGSLRSAPSRTADGPTNVGQWTLGSRAGRNSLVVTAGQLAPFTITATGTPGPPVAMSAVRGNNQEAPAGDLVSQPLAALVTDRFDNPVAQQAIRFEVLGGGGTVAPETVQTDVDGIAAGVRWRLGPRSSIQTVRASMLPLATEFAARARSDFTIDVRFPGTPPSAQFQEAFRNAAERIRTAVVGDLPDVSVQALDVSRCGGGAGVTLSESIDDIVIFATVAPIDGVGRVLARAGPCFVRNTTLQSLVGTMQFDDADAIPLLTSDRFEAVVLHEMLHVVGIGSLWRLKNLVSGSGTGDPRFNGPIGTARCVLTGFGSQCDGGVPLETLGGSGTAEVHWRESVFDRELMTGFAEATNDMPFSVITIGALSDYGFEVNDKAADPFQFTAARSAPRRAPSPSLPWEELLFPAFQVSRFGFVQPLPARADDTPRRK